VTIAVTVAVTIATITVTVGVTVAVVITTIAVTIAVTVAFVPPRGAAAVPSFMPPVMIVYDNLMLGWLSWRSPPR
jgi:hypothetical protein